ncbi:MAG: NlpC/P60 family protein [Hyphomonadaceae bacterium]|nr:NlpC/P60 family protein [Hyphomonadaceae bacterium]
MTHARTIVIEEALRWRGTPYRHQGSVHGAGCDCLGLVRAIWRRLYGEEPEPVPPYTPDWSEDGPEALLEGARRWLVEVEAAAPGDVVLFRMAPGGPVKHAAILTAPSRIVHAYWGRAVVESRFTSFWRTRVAASFSFPGVDSWLR